MARYLVLSGKETEILYRGEDAEEVKKLIREQKPFDEVEFCAANAINVYEIEKIQVSPTVDGFSITKKIYVGRNHILSRERWINFSKRALEAIAQDSDK